ncbi:hypothetical protein [Kitasatospora sp. NPDC057541]|uniref:hypothetical protein n=1 Tax=unclassified Kitasatospora TaxID=2633591 RepID=UPI0036A26CBA
MADFEQRPERPERPDQPEHPEQPDRPLAELIDAFWQGSVPAPVDDPWGEVSTALDELGPTGLTSRGRPLDAALAAAYRRFTGAG